jgi:hypothetical protein
MRYQSVLCEFSFLSPTFQKCIEQGASDNRQVKPSNKPDVEVFGHASFLSFAEGLQSCTAASFAGPSAHWSDRMPLQIDLLASGPLTTRSLAHHKKLC